MLHGSRNPPEPTTQLLIQIALRHQHVADLLVRDRQIALPAGTPHRAKRYLYEAPASAMICRTSSSLRGGPRISIPASPATDVSSGTSVITSPSRSMSGKKRSKPLGVNVTVK